MIDIKLVTQKGILKPLSEDTVFVYPSLWFDAEESFTMNQSSVFCGVLDGVGGNQGGREASQYIAKRLATTKVVMNQIEDLKNYILEINDDLIELGIKNNTKEMATTLSGIYKDDQKTFLYHIGNTRVYTKTNTYVNQLTTDHTVVNQLISKGLYDQAKITNPSIIYGCLGGGNHHLSAPLHIQTIDYPIHEIIMTTDGIHDFVSDDMIETILATHDDIDALKELIRLAIKKGSHDDLSVLWIKFKKEKEI